MIISRLHLTTLIGVVVGIWAILLILAGFPVTNELFDPFSKVIGILVIITLLFDKWLWKLSFLHPWFVLFPDISGTWKGTIVSSWRSESLGEPVEPIDAFLVIYQTYSSINIQMITKESKSDLLSGNFIQNESGRNKIAGIYNNVPNLMIREQSPIHYGGLLLEISMGDTPRLEGEYWTSRNTKGILKFDKRITKLFDSYDGALSYFQSWDITVRG